MPRQIRKMKIKIVLVGERAVGKTSLIHRYLFNTFDDTYRGTLGSKLHLLSFSKYVTADQIVEAQVALFDLMGEHAPRDAFRDAIFWGAHGFLAVADLTRSDTLYQLPLWVEAVHSVAEEVPYTLILNKADLVPNSAIGPRETHWLLSKFPEVPYALASAKTGMGVGAAFDALIERVVDRVLERSRARRHLNVLAERMLVFALKRGTVGVTKNELLLAFKGTDYGTIMAEVDALHQLGYVVKEEIGPGNFRIILTPLGEASATKPERDEFVVEEPT
ncbi:MAG: GTP-binding protein [Euryarchaeota archaeon]|nr:GTP-binding protein [Euryarchaeota archaeon]